MRELASCDLEFLRRSFNVETRYTRRIDGPTLFSAIWTVNRGATQRLHWRLAPSFSTSQTFHQGTGGLFDVLEPARPAATSRCINSFSSPGRWHGFPEQARHHLSAPSQHRHPRPQKDSPVPRLPSHPLAKPRQRPIQTPQSSRPSPATFRHPARLQRRSSRPGHHIS